MIMFCCVDPFGAECLDAISFVFWMLIVVNVLMSRIDLHYCFIFCFQWSQCMLSMSSPCVNGSLLIDVNEGACDMMIGSFAEIVI